MKKKKTKYFRDPVHGFIEVSPFELKIVEHPLFQRLRRIKQLGPAYYVFHGAVHTRFGHSLGVMNIAKKILRNISEYVSEDDYSRIVIAALLHDIGQFPLSHTFEKVISSKFNIKGHEEYTEAIIRKTSISDILREKFSNRDIDIIVDYIRGRGVENPFALQIIHSELDADRLDYLLRDSLFCGVKYGIYDLDRLLMSLVIDENGNQLVVAKKGIYVAEEFVLARFYMYRQVYIYKTKRAFEIMVSRIMDDLLNNIISYPNVSNSIDEDELVEKDDYWLISEFRNVLKSRNPQVSSYTKDLIKRYLFRKPIKLVKDIEQSIDKRSQKFTRDYILLKNLNNRVDFRNKLKELNISTSEIFIDEPIINVKQHPYEYQPEEEEGQIPILIYKDEKDKQPIDIAAREGSIIKDISLKFLGIIRVYTFEKNRQKIEKVINEIIKAS